MNAVPKLSRFALCSALVLAGTSAFAQSAAHPMAPALERLGRNLGQEQPSTRLNLTAWLNLHNKATLDARVQALYTPGSPSYHQWMTLEDLKPFTPTEAEITLLKKELAASHLTVTSVDPLNLSVHFTGQTSDVERAFHTQINRYSLKGDTVHTSSSLPALSGAAAPLLQHLGGLNSMPMKPHIRLATNPATNQKLRTRTNLASAAAGPIVEGGSYSNVCFAAPATTTLQGISAQDGVSPASATFQGLIYGPNTSEENFGSFGCGYAATDITKIYGLQKAYALGLKGQGQTIVIVDAFLQPTIQSDVDQFDKDQNLPALDASNFEVLNPYGAYIPGYAVEGNWNAEAALDVEWAHAIAPAAKIKLIQAFSPDSEDLEGAVLYAITHKLGNIISNSYGSPESLSGQIGNQVWDEVNEFGASQGVALQFSTGDDGDLVNAIGVADVESPANSPYATAIGGTSVAFLSDDVTLTTGWGSNTTQLAFAGYVEDQLGGESQFQYGAGGGSSAFFAKPAYQSALPGPGRHLPDVSALADPYTGAELVYSYSADYQYRTVGGGTSLAAPIFSGIWALIDQAAGTTLGQAAPYIASAPAPLIEDVLPVNGLSNLSGSYTGPEGHFTFSVDDLAQPLANTGPFTSALWSPLEGYLESITFGTDSSLTITQGWDNVTGYGTPNIGATVDALLASKK